MRPYIRINGKVMKEIAKAKPKPKPKAKPKAKPKTKANDIININVDDTEEKKVYRRELNKAIEGIEKWTTRLQKYKKGKTPMDKKETRELKVLIKYNKEKKEHFENKLKGVVKEEGEVKEAKAYNKKAFMKKINNASKLDEIKKLTDELEKIQKQTTGDKYMEIFELLILLDRKRKSKSKK